MSFGLFKSGANNTDKRLIRRYVAAGWPVDKISSKLSIKPTLVKKIVSYQAKQARDNPRSAPAVAQISAAEEVAQEEAAEAELKKAQAEATGSGPDKESTAKAGKTGK